jgi:ribosomal protein S18 acetylase RimI-like enzyme
MAERVLEEHDENVRIVRVRTQDDAAPYRASFAGAYQDIFSEPPYNERFFPEEANAVLQQHLMHRENIVIMAISGRAKVVGFGISVPVDTRADISRELRGLLPTRHTYYLAEMGVLSSYRGTGLGSKLVQWRMDLINHRRFSHVVLRTSAVRNASYEMYLRRGFDDMGVYMEVSSRRIDGRVTTDRRLFLTKVLPPPDELSGDDETEELPAHLLKTFEDGQNI